MVINRTFMSPGGTGDAGAAAVVAKNRTKTAALQNHLIPMAGHLSFSIRLDGRAPNIFRRRAPGPAGPDGVILETSHPRD